MAIYILIDTYLPSSLQMDEDKSNSPRVEAILFLDTNGITLIKVSAHDFEEIFLFLLLLKIFPIEGKRNRPNPK
jgi:hypothetical protein